MKLPPWTIRSYLVPDGTHLTGLCLIAAYVAIGAIVISIFFPRQFVFLATGDTAPTLQIEIYDKGGQKIERTAGIRRDYFQGRNRFYSGITFSAVTVERFRLTLNGVQPVELSELVVVRKSLLLTSHQYYSASDLIAGLQGITVDAMSYVPNSGNSFIEFDVSKHAGIEAREFSWDCLFVFLFALVSVAGAKGVAAIIKIGNFFPWLAFVSVMSMVVAMIWALPLDHGPDEAMHYASYFWYFEHVRPPSLALGDRIYMNPVWQTSYVFGMGSDLTYVVTAKLSSLLSWLFPSTDSLSSLRLAQIYMIVAGLGLCALFAGEEIAIAYMLCWAAIPQLAYTATYLNGDVLSFVGGFIAFALVIQKSPPDRWTALAVLFILFNVKSNYLPLALLACGYWLLAAQKEKWPNPKMLLFGLLGLSLIMYRRVFNTIDQLWASQSYLENIYARVLALDLNAYPYTLVKANYERRLAGMQALDWTVATDLNWYVSSFKSFFGVFGYMNFQIPQTLLWFAVLSFAYVFILASHSNRNRIFIGCGLVLTLAASLYFSMSNSPQAQGRYLFPIICVVFVLACPRLRRHQTAISFSAAGTLLSLSLFG